VTSCRLHDQNLHWFLMYKVNNSGCHHFSFKKVRLLRFFRANHIFLEVSNVLGI
jgi:hypothetical protein